MRLSIVLHEPQDLVNIAAAVRAMANMGLRRLTVVNPAEFDPWRITGIAHRTEHIVESVERAGSLEEALADATYVVGTSARPRTAQRNYRRPRELAPRILRRAGEGNVAIVFGREDRGLSNEALDRCDEVAVIPTAQEYSSLNLAQAVLLIAYELFLAGAGEAESLPVGKRSLGPATHGEMEEMFGALEQGLDRVDFFKARKAESVMRTVRTVFGRTTLDAHEARLIRSMGYEVRNRIDRESSGT
ncbi:MAG: RNA methyltransferase [Gemmatimonadetes bacterium]|nr:RNA methyltransferase [Gemmatimonadota bacterium]